MQKCEIKGYAEKLLSELYEQRKTTDFKKEEKTNNCDCKIEIVSSTSKFSVPVHFPIVSQASPFCAISKKNKQIVIKADVSEKSLEKCVKFMYLGKVEVEENTAEDTAKLSHILGLQELKRHCLEVLYLHLSNSSVEAFQSLVSICESKEYRRKTIKYLVEHASRTKVEINGASAEVVHDYEISWKSALAMFKNSRSFQENYNVIEVLEAIEIQKFPCEFLLSDVISNKLVCGERVLFQGRLRLRTDEEFYVAKLIRQKINENVSILTAKNFYLVWSLNESFELEFKTLKPHLRDFMTQHFEVLAEKDEFLELQDEDAKYFLSHPKLFCSSEETKYNALMRWVKHIDARAWLFPRLFKTITLDNLDNNVFDDMKSEPLIDDNRELRQRLFTALLQRAKNGSTTVPKSVNRSKSCDVLYDAKSGSAGKRISELHVSCDTISEIEPNSPFSSLPKYN